MIYIVGNNKTKTPGDTVAISIRDLLGYGIIKTNRGKGDSKHMAVDYPDAIDMINSSPTYVFVDA